MAISVNPINDDPSAVDDALSISEDAGGTIVPVLDNDSDVDGDDFFVTGVTDPPHGTATVNAESVVTYTPDAELQRPRHLQLLDHPTARAAPRPVR